MHFLPNLTTKCPLRINILQIRTVSPKKKKKVKYLEAVFSQCTSSSNMVHPSFKSKQHVYKIFSGNKILRDNAN